MGLTKKQMIENLLMGVEDAKAKKTLNFNYSVMHKSKLVEYYNYCKSVGKI